MAVFLLVSALLATALGKDVAIRVANALGALIVIGVGVRALNAGVVIQTPDRIVVREVWRTRRLARDLVIRFAAEEGRVWRFAREGGWFLTAEVVGDAQCSFTEINAPANLAGQAEMERIASALNLAWGKR